MGLIGGMARTAVIAGTATAVSNRVSRRQANRWAQEDQSAYAAAPAPAPVYQAPPAAPAQYAPAPPAQEDVYEQLRKFGQLKDAGILSEEEFAAKKAQLLGL
jgi:Short C-terminal domain